MGEAKNTNILKGDDVLKNVRFYTIDGIRYRSFQTTNLDYVLVRDTEAIGIKNHSHFKNEFGCIYLIKFIENKKLPRDKYYKEALKRVQTKEELKEYSKTRVKKHVNIQKGAVK